MRGGEARTRRRIVGRNRKARHEYEVLNTLETGVELAGSEVKSLRAGHLSFQDAHAVVRDGELWLRSLHIAPYREAGAAGHDATRPRRLLVHRHEIRKLAAAVDEKGLALVPLSVYFSRGLAKVELGVVRGRKMHDKRERLRRREQDLEAERAMKRA